MRRKFRKYRRFKKFRKRKSLLKSRFFWIFISISALIILVFYLFFLSGIFKIKEIEISVPEDVSEEEIQVLLEEELETSFFIFFRKDTFFLVDSQKIEDRILKEYPEIKTADLKKEFPQTLILKIERKREVAICCLNDNDCFLIDRDGIIFGGSTSGDLMVIFLEDGEIKNLGEEIIPKEKMNQLLGIHDELKKNLGIDVKKFILEGSDSLNVKTIEGWEIYFDLTGDINLILTKLSLLLEEEISSEVRENLEYIDLRFSKVYYK